MSLDFHIDSYIDIDLSKAVYLFHQVYLPPFVNIDFYIDIDLSYLLPVVPGMIAIFGQYRFFYIDIDLFIKLVSSVPELPNPLLNVFLNICYIS